MRVLIVDDSPVDRRVAAGVLERREGVEVRFAADGAEALERIASGDLDLVLTDLVMEGMCGLELTRTVRERHPDLPVILMTGKGNEQTAVEALQAGAASYVPKRLLQTDLLETLESVVEVVGKEHPQTRLLSRLSRSEYAFVLENDPRLIPAAVRFVRERTARLGLFDDTERIQVAVALEEALQNAIYHGNLEVSSALKEESFDAYYRLAEERSEENPFRGRRVFLEVRLTGARASFTVRDEGSGFDPSTVPNPTSLPNLDRVSGRGILLMRTFMTSVTFNREGNEVTMVKESGLAG